MMTDTLTHVRRLLFPMQILALAPLALAQEGDPDTGAFDIWTEEEILQFAAQAQFLQREQPEIKTELPDAFPDGCPIKATGVLTPDAKAKFGGVELLSLLGESYVEGKGAAFYSVLGLSAQIYRRTSAGGKQFEEPQKLYSNDQIPGLTTTCEAGLINQIKIYGEYAGQLPYDLRWSDSLEKNQERLEAKEFSCTKKSWPSVMGSAPSDKLTCRQPSLQLVLEYTNTKLLTLKQASQ